MKTLIFLSFITSFLSASLRSELRQGEPGSYCVFEHQKNCTLLHLHSKKNETIIIEEISIPAHAKIRDWKEWVQSNAPGHTSWILYEFDAVSGELLECYSFMDQCWLKASQSLLSKLINLELKPVKSKERKRIGVTPPHHAIDIRKIWNPPKIFEGQTIKGSRFHARYTHWPKDDSEIANKRIELYFDENGFPFPYWIEIKGKIDRHLHAIDSGTYLKSPKDHLPRRYPHVIGYPKKQKTSFLYELETPLYYKNFQLFCGTSPLEAIITQSNEKLYIQVEQRQVKSEEPLLLMPNSHPHIFVELPK